MNLELKEALDNLASDLQGKTAIEVKTLTDEFKVEFKSAIVEEIKKGNLTQSEEFKAELKKVQDYANELDVKLQKKSAKLNAPVDEIKSIITDNFEAISEVKKGKSVSIETKAVANMTLTSALTGDQPRDYSMAVAMKPGQLLNVADIVGSVTISGGTYTFPREGTNEGTITTQVEGADKAQVDFDLAMIDVNTDFIAGFVVYSKKMANNLPFLESFLPNALRRDYWINENRLFNVVMASGTTASTQIITGKNKIQMLINEIATLEGSNFSSNGVVVTPADYWDIMSTEKSTGAGYGLPGFVTYESGVLRINGIPVYKANWVLANKYYVGDFSQIKKVVTMGLSVEFSEHDEDNFRKNNISARVEAQVGLAIERIDAVIYGDFTAV